MLSEMLMAKEQRLVLKGTQHLTLEIASSWRSRAGRLTLRILVGYHLDLHVQSVQQRGFWGANASGLF